MTPDMRLPLTLNGASTIEALMGIVIQHPTKELILIHGAKQMMAEIMAEYGHGKATFDHINKFHVLRGFTFAAWDEGDPSYLGCWGNRIWFGYGTGTRHDDHLGHVGVE